MPNPVRCPMCGHVGTIPDKTTRVNCSKCGERFPVASQPPSVCPQRRPIDADLYELEREFFAARRDLREVLVQVNTAFDDLKAHPVSDQHVEQFRRARQHARNLDYDHEVAQKKLDDVDSEIARIQDEKQAFHRKLNRSRLLFSPVGQGLVCAGEVLLLLLMSAPFFLKVPTGIWAILFAVLALGAVAITLAVFSLKKQSHANRVDWLISSLASAEQAESALEPGRASSVASVEAAYARWVDADKIVQQLKGRIRPWIRHERALEEYEDVHQYYERVRADYENAQTERRLRLLRRDWRDLKAGQFESFVARYSNRSASGHFQRVRPEIRALTLSRHEMAFGGRYSARAIRTLWVTSPYRKSSPVRVYTIARNGWLSPRAGLHLGVARLRSTQAACSSKVVTFPN